MEVTYTDEFDRQGTVYYVNDAVPEHAMYAESDSDSMSTCSSQSARTITSSEVSGQHRRATPRPIAHIGGRFLPGAVWEGVPAGR